jgi:hypothetical protein
VAHPRRATLPLFPVDACSHAEVSRSQARGGPFRYRALPLPEQIKVSQCLKNASSTHALLAIGGQDLALDQAQGPE